METLLVSILLVVGHCIFNVIPIIHYNVFILKQQLKLYSGGLLIFEIDEKSSFAINISKAIIGTL